MLKRRLTAFSLFIIIIVTLLTGCNQNQAKIKPSNVEMITVTDSVGREIQVPKKIDKIGCLFTVSGHIVTMKGKK